MNLRDSTLVEAQGSLAHLRGVMMNWHPNRHTVHLVEEQVELLVRLAELALRPVATEAEWVELKRKILPKRGKPTETSAGPIEPYEAGSTLQPQVIADALLASKRADDRALVVALRAGLHADGRWYSNIAEHAIGDTYAPRGRIRSRGISRAKCRGIEIGVLRESRDFFVLAPKIGRAVAELIRDR